MKTTLPRHLRTYNNSEPHPDWGDWQGFLKSCELRDEHEGVLFFGKTNCNYIIFPDGLIVQNYGYHGAALMGRIREEGVEVVRRDLEKLYQELKDVLARLRV